MGDSEKLGPYELRGELGRGAMARVWRAYDANLDREVAIKEPLFDSNLSDDVLAELSERFVREGKAAARLNHPGIVTIYAADVYDKRPAIVMELIDGVTLGDMLDQGAMAPQASIDVLDQLLDAAGYAHAQGVVHRDIKPDNIFVTTDGRVKLADFGIAHVDDPKLTKRTQIGTVLGTPGYMAPEQATGGTVDNRTDLFSIGTIAYEMLTGRNPFGAGDGTDVTTLLYRIVHEPAPELSEVVSSGLPADVRPAVLAALSKNPEDRPQDASAFKAMLHGSPVPIGSSHSVGSSTLTQVAAKSERNKWMPYAIVGAIGVVAIIGLFFFATSSGGGGGIVDGGGIMPQQTADGTVASAPGQIASTAYLIDEDGFVVVYRGTLGGASEFDHVTDIQTTKLDANVANQLLTGISVDSIETAESTLTTYREYLVEQANKRVFVAVAGKRTWSEALAYCQSQGGTLACINSEDDYNQIVAAASNLGLRVYWLGGYMEGGALKWTNGKTGSFSMWAAGEPNNDLGIEDKMALLNVNGMWGCYDVPGDFGTIYRAEIVGLIMELPAS